jgi:hypothetical protein
VFEKLRGLELARDIEKFTEIVSLSVYSDFHDRNTSLDTQQKVFNEVSDKNSMLFGFSNEFFVRASGPLRTRSNPRVP